MKTSPKAFLTKYWWLVAVVAGFALVSAPLLIFPAYQGHDLNAQNAAEFGDFVGGYIGTLLALASVVALVSTLRRQTLDSEFREFSEKYFQLLRLHRDNVAEMKIHDDQGRKIFVEMLKEFRGIHAAVRGVNGAYSFQMTLEQMAEISYLALFYGVGRHASPMLRNALTNAGYDAWIVGSIVDRLEQCRQEVRKEQGLHFAALDGHQSRLGHYYRHLFQSVKFVHAQAMSDDRRYEQVKTIRAQLSTQEQALLLLNSMTAMGRRWRQDEDVDLILRYKLVKNIPRDFFARYELDLETMFGSRYFEWQPTDKGDGELSGLT